MQFLSLSAGVVALIFGGVLLAIVIVVAIWAISSHNALVGVRNDVEEAFSAMDVHLKKRYDLIPNLVEVCKGYAAHESETLIRVAEARNAAMALASGGTGDRIAAERELSISLSHMMTMVREQYPQLKADAQFINLSNQLTRLEEEIARSRSFYNAKVKIFNNKIQKFPSNIVAGMMHLQRKEYFEVDDASERVAPKVSFS